MSVAPPCIPPSNASPPVSPNAASDCAQVAGGVPAMCGGVTQGRAGMDVSLFSRDVIATSFRWGLLLTNSPCC